jgi:hypothetical protein
LFFYRACSHRFGLEPCKTKLRGDKEQQGDQERRCPGEVATAELRVQTDFSWQRLLINACDYIHHPVYLHKNAVSRNLLTIVNRTG